MSVALALLSALCYGASDFAGGVAARRIHYARAGVLAQATAVVCVLTAVPFAGGQPTAQALLWGAVSGLGSGVGSVALFRGLARGQMAVAGPVSGAGSATLPVVAGLLLGERPSWLTLGGVVLVIPAVWLISSSGSLRGRGVVEGAVDGLLAGLGFGALFLALAQVGSGTGLWAVGTGHLVSVTVIGAFALATARRVPARPPSWRHRAVAILAGVLSGAATVTYLLSTRHGLLVVVAVLAALYPAVTVLLARFLLHERSSHVQLVGLVVAAVAVVLITVG